MNLARPLNATIGMISDADPLPPDDRTPVQPERSLAELYQSQRSRLRRFFSRRAGDVDADDLVHEAFARYAARTGESAAFVVEPEAYLQTVASNLLRNRALLALRRATAFHDVYDDEAVSDADPMRRLEDRDALRRLDKAVQRLRPRTREVFLLQRVDGMTYAQIADRMGLSVKGVKKQMAKALFELRRDVGSL